MGTYDSRRLDIAIQYIRRMAEGRNPVNNRPAPENEVLTNVNVNRCLKFVEEINHHVPALEMLTRLTIYRKKAGMTQRQLAAIAEIFPYEVLSGFKYEQDQQISYFLKQVTGLLPEDQSMTIQATMVTDWLRENGYLEKRMFKETGKENSVPTEKGIDLGLYAEKAGAFPNEYYRVYYNQNAQQFIVDNLRRIIKQRGRDLHTADVHAIVLRVFVSFERQMILRQRQADQISCSDVYADFILSLRDPFLQIPCSTGMHAAVRIRSVEPVTQQREIDRILLTRIRLQNPDSEAGAHGAVCCRQCEYGAFAAVKSGDGQVLIIAEDGLRGSVVIH